MKEDTINDGGLVESLADCALMVLDDMGKDGKCCCNYAKARLRIALEPFIEEPAEQGQLNDYWRSSIMDLEEAERIVKECDE